MTEDELGEQYEIVCRLVKERTGLAPESLSGELCKGLHILAHHSAILQKDVKQDIMRKEVLESRRVELGKYFDRFIKRVKRGTPEGYSFDDHVDFVKKEIAKTTAIPDSHLDAIADRFGITRTVAEDDGSFGKRLTATLTTPPKGVADKWRTEISKKKEPDFDFVEELKKL